MQERRTAPRQKTFLKGTVYFNHRLSSVECLVRDFSELGARLQIPASVTLPRVFELDIPARDQTLHAQVVWRKDDEIGVVFGAAAAEPGQAAAAGSLEQRLEALEREVDKLHRSLLELRAHLRHMRGED